MSLKKGEPAQSSESDENLQIQIIPNRVLRGLLFAAGTLCVALGLIGIILPILPTTPFLLLAAWCYARSSKRYYKWLISNKWFGKYIKNYREGKGIPLRAKVSAITILWITILISIIFFVTNLYIRIIMIVTAGVVSIYIVSIKPKTRIK